ncbi:uncharacterized protein [Littorina saxatilis]|uniref:Arrestin C-terminal-like domain-containing protein n=1 Tax=Littorina saxatilis TaxID=31220 RepID=A0AAN9C2T1_9CAEN
MTKTRMEITAAPGRVVRPGHQITCCVRVVTDRPIQVNHGVVRLEGEARSVPFDVYRLAANSGNMVVSLYERHAVVQRYGYQPFAFRHRAADNPSPLILQGGSSWDGMVITIPSPAPDTWRGNRGHNGSVKYRVVAELRYNSLDVNQRPVGMEKRLLEEVEVVVRNVADVRDFCLDENAADRTEKLVRGMWGSSGLVKCELFLPLRTFVLGDAIPADVHIVNRSPRAIRHASLALFQEMTFTDSISPSRPGSVSYTVTDELHELSLLRVEPGGSFHRTVAGLMAPAYGLTSGSFRGSSCISVRFFVQLKVKWFFGSLKSSVNIILGSTRSSEKNGTPSTGEGKFPDLGCRSEAEV